MEKFARKSIGLVILAVVLLFFTQCAEKSSNDSPAAPKDLLGISVGMNKADAERQLKEIAEFERAEKKRQQVWRLKNDPRFNQLAIGYDKENRVRYITVFVDEKGARERLRFADAGEVSKAEKQITAPHHRYIWTVAAQDGKPTYVVSLYGADPEFITTYSLAKSEKPEADD